MHQINSPSFFASESCFLYNNSNKTKLNYKTKKKRKEKKKLFFFFNAKIKKNSNKNKENELLVFGKNTSSNQLITKEIEVKENGKRYSILKQINKIRSIKSSWNSTMILYENGDVYIYGDLSNFGSKNNFLMNDPSIKFIYSGLSSFLILHKNGDLYGIGHIKKKNQLI